MRKIITAAVIAVISLCALLCACNISADSSLKELTKPYITRYECTRAEWGGQNFLDGYEYIRITLADESNMELSYKKPGESEHKFNCRYNYDQTTGELTAEGTALGIKMRESVKIENGKFTISLPLLGKQLVMDFES